MYINKTLETIQVVFSQMCVYILYTDVNFQITSVNIVFFSRKKLKMIYGISDFVIIFLLSKYETFTKCKIIFFFYQGLVN